MRPSDNGARSLAKNIAITYEIRGQLGDTWSLDEVFIKINGVLHYLWRAVVQDDDELIS
jgi:transposase-like protein